MKNRNGLISTLFAWNDLLLSVFAACIMLLGIFIAIINQKATEEEEPNSKTGSVAVYCFWENGIDADVDIHVLDPKGGHNYYIRMQGEIWSILRDDLGGTSDPGLYNFENAATRGLTPGKYVVNVHAYRATAGLYPIKVDCEIRINPKEGASNRHPVVIRHSVELIATGDEKTVIAFKLNEDGALDHDSVSHLFETIVRR